MSRSARRRRPWWLLAWVCGSLIFCAGERSFAQADAARQADAALDDYNFAIGLYQKSRWDLAADAFQKFLKQHADHPKAAYATLYLGLSLVNEQKYAPARDVLREFVRRYPKSRNRPDAMYRVGECSYLLDDLKAADTELTAFLDAYPKHDLAEWALPYLADAQLRLHKPESALEHFKKSLEQFPHGRMTEDAKFGTARAYEALKQTDSAVEIYQQLAADRAVTRAPQAQLSLGTLYYQSGQYDKAARAYAELPTRFPESDLVPTARLNAGFAWYQLKDYPKAIQEFEAAAKDARQQVTATYWKGVSQKALANYDEAVASLKQAFEQQPDGPLAADALYQWADCEFRRGQYDDARQRFLEVVRRWPQSESADDSLHFAAESALLAGDLDEANSLADRFEQEYPNSNLWAHHGLLRGRLLAARGGDANLKAAVERFQHVLADSKLPRTQSLARFYLARTLQSLGDHEGALAAVSPLVDQVKTEGADSEFADALIFQGTSLMALEKFEAAGEAMSTYLEWRPKGDQAAQALATRALAEAHLKQKSQAQADLARLTAHVSAQSPADSATATLAAQTTQQLAELAYADKDWAWSAELFGSLVDMGKATPYHAAGLSGRAWSLFQQKKYREAADGFAAVVTQHPDDLALASEAAYMQGKSLQEAGDAAAAVEVFRTAFEKYAPNTEAAAEAEEHGPTRFAYLSGLQSARLYGELQKIDEADAAYEQLAAKFPKSKSFDELLDEWALLNYNAGRYDRSDAVFRRLVEETPHSDLADNARYSLAESDLNAGRLDAARKTFQQLSTAAESDKQVKENSLYRLIGIAVDESAWKDVPAHVETLLKAFPESGYRPYAEFSRSEARLFLGDVQTAQETLLGLKQAEAGTPAAQAPWFPRVWVLLAETYYRQKQYGDAVTTVDELRSRFPQATVLYQADEILGRCYKNQALFDKAREAFQRVVTDEHGRRTETAAKAQFLIAETYLIQKAYRDAQREYLKVYYLYKFPAWQAPALYQAAQCDEQLEQWDNAVKSYEDLLQEFPNSEFADKAKSRLPTVRDKNPKGIHKEVIR